MEEPEADEIRSPVEVAKRTIALFSVVDAALGSDRTEVLDWLNKAGLIGELSPIEAAFLNDPSPSDRVIVNASWYSERLITLLWALKLSEMPPFDQRCDTSLFRDVLPPYADTAEQEFINTAQLRPETELLEMADHILDHHWEARDAKIKNRLSNGVDIEVVQERHHAINWVVGYDDGAPWDEVTTDT